MKKKLFVPITLLLALSITSCKKEFKASEAEKPLSHSNTQTQNLNQGNATGEFVTLNSGIVVEKFGANYFLQSDILLSDSQFQLLDKEGVLNSVEKDKFDANNSILISPAYGKIFHTPSVLQTRNVGVHPNENKMWAMVRYVIRPELDYFDRLAISSAIKHWEENTNIRFYNATNQPTKDPQWGFWYPYIEFFHGTSNDPNAWNRKGNWSSVGRWDVIKNINTHGRSDAGQWISLQSYPSTGTVIHEIGHAIGVYHEHTRPDRDNYINVNYSNISGTENQKKANFDKIQSNYSMFGAFDFNSIMLYGPFDFAINSSIPVLSHKDGSVFSTNTTNLSFNDRLWANNYYIPYIARSDVYRELAPVVYKTDNTAMTPQERINFQAYLNNGNPNPPNCCKLPNSHDF